MLVLNLDVAMSVYVSNNPIGLTSITSFAILLKNEPSICALLVEEKGISMPKDPLIVLKVFPLLFSKTNISPVIMSNKYSIDTPSYIYSFSICEKPIKGKYKLIFVYGA